LKKDIITRKAADYAIFASSGVPEIIHNTNSTRIMRGHVG
jgi:hypothetical protein